MYLNEAMYIIIKYTMPKLRLTVLENKKSTQVSPDVNNTHNAHTSDVHDDTHIMYTTTHTLCTQHMRCTHIT